jgi:hypothetical protein
METPGDSRNCQTPGVLRQSRRVSFWTKPLVIGQINFTRLFVPPTATLTHGTVPVCDGGAVLSHP